MTIKGMPDVAFRLPGLGRFEATGPTKDVEQLRKKWERACKKFDTLTAGFGTRDLDELERLHQKAADLEGQIHTLDEKIETLLGGRTVDEIQAERNRADAIVREVLERFPEWGDEPPDVGELAHRAAELARQVKDGIDEAQKDLELAQGALSEAEKAKVRHEDQIANVRKNAARVQEEIDELCADGKTDAERQEELTKIAMERDAANRHLQRVQRQLDAFDGDPSEVVEHLEKQLGAVREKAQKARDKLNQLEGRMQELTAQAPYTELAKVEEEIAGIKDRISQQQLQLDAIRLLHTVLQEEKQQMLDAVIDPVRRRATRTLQRIAGRRFREIEFDESLLPKGIAPRAQDVPVELDEISGGEREQVYFAVRLALAEVAFPNERQLLVLDDVFTYTDTVRLARVATILDEAAERFQILLLTCHPERYHGVADGKLFDLEALTSR